MVIADSHPEDAADSERLRGRPVRQPCRNVRPVRDDVARVLAAPREDDLPHRQRDDQRVEPQQADEDAVDEPHEHADAESGEDRDGKVVVRAGPDPGDQVSGCRDDAGRRQVDAALNDDEHLAERRDGENGRVRAGCTTTRCARGRPAPRTRQRRGGRRSRARPEGTARRVRRSSRAVERRRPRTVPSGAAMKGWPRPRDILTRSSEQCQ